MQVVVNELVLTEDVSKKLHVVSLLPGVIQNRLLTRDRTTINIFMSYCM
jgi:hypothetical protein